MRRVYRGRGGSVARHVSSHWWEIDQVKKVKKKSPYRWGKLHEMIVEGMDKPILKLLEMVPWGEEPNSDNVIAPNAWIMVEMRDRLFGLLDLYTRNKAIRNLINYFIIKYEDAFYKEIFNWAVETFIKEYADKWEFRKPDRPEINDPWIPKWFKGL